MKLRILFLQTFPLWGCGSGTYVRSLAQELAKNKNNRVAIMCPDTRQLPCVKLYPAELDFFAAFTGHPEYPNCKLYHELASMEIFKIYENFLKSSIKAVEDFKPNIIHVQHSSVLSWAANFIKAVYRINYIVTEHGTSVYAASLDKRYVNLTVDALRRAKRITAVSGDTRDWLLNIFGRDFAEKTRTIPGGIDIAKLPAEYKIKAINKKYNLDGKKVVLFTGKLTKVKGVKYLIKAAPKIKGDIYIIGDGPEKENLARRIIEMNLKNVHLLGYMGDADAEEFKEFYYRADVFVAPSVWDEPLGLVILEAMACKTPVVVTRKGGIPLAVQDGVNGIFVRPHNSNQIADAVNKLLENDELRNKMGENARRIVKSKFTWDKIAQKFERIYAKYATLPPVAKNGNGNGNGKNKK